MKLFTHASADKTSNKHFSKTKKEKKMPQGLSGECFQRGNSEDNSLFPVTV